MFRKTRSTRKKQLVYDLLQHSQKILFRSSSIFHHHTKLSFTPSAWLPPILFAQSPHLFFLQQSHALYTSPSFVQHFPRLFVHFSNVSCFPPPSHLLLSFDFPLSTCPSLFAAVHPPALCSLPGPVIMKLTDISSLAVDSLHRAKAYGDYLPVEEGATGSAHSVPAATGFFELTVSSLLQHSLTLFLSWGPSQHLHLPPSFCLSGLFILHPCHYTPTIHVCFLFLSLSFSFFLHRPHPPSGNYGKICNSARRSW